MIFADIGLDLDISSSNAISRWHRIKDNGGGVRVTYGDKKLANEVRSKYHDFILSIDRANLAGLGVLAEFGLNQRQLIVFKSATGTIQVYDSNQMETILSDTNP